MMVLSLIDDSKVFVNPVHVEYIYEDRRYFDGNEELTTVVKMISGMHFITRQPIAEVAQLAHEFMKLHFSHT